jgi:hypothetical protein
MDGDEEREDVFPEYAGNPEAWTEIGAMQEA